ncbi:MAG: sugar transferase [Planctomycetota bacterium]|nr:MAG: sugar transferase [Planctomycetota bacterium]
MVVRHPLLTAAPRWTDSRDGGFSRTLARLSGANVGVAASAISASVDATVSRRSRASRLARLVLNLSPTSWAWFDAALIFLATYCAHVFMLDGNPRYQWVAGPWISGGVFSGGIIFAGVVFGLYERRTLGARSRILVRGAMSLVLGVILAYALLSLFLYLETTRWLGLAVAFVYCAAAIPLRIVAHEAISSSRLNVLCIGAGESIRQVTRMLERNPPGHYRLLGCVDVPPANSNAAATPGEPDGALDNCPRLGGLDDIPRIFKKYHIDEVVVDVALAGEPAVGEAVLQCLDHRCRVTDQPTFVETLLGETPIESITAHWFLVADVGGAGSYDAVKRLLDLAIAAIGLLLTAPFFPLIALAIRLDSRGPALYRQTRVGRNGRLFQILKFRTMRHDAEADGARWARRNDDRVTRLGRFLRRSRIDELPQLWNILRGEMSIVGPRPERPEFVEQLAQQIPHYRQRHLIKPGLTGWAQIHYGYGDSITDARRKLCYDLYYLKHRSIDFDFAIIIRTLGRFLFGAR